MEFHLESHLDGDTSRNFWLQRQSRGAPRQALQKYSELRGRHLDQDLCTCDIHLEDSRC